MTLNYRIFVSLFSLLTIATFSFSLNWIQEESTSLARSKRNLPLVFPDGGTFKLLLGFAVPIKNPVNVSAVLAYNWQFQYAVPPNITFFTKYYPFVQLARKKRSLIAKENYDQRLFFYKSMENTMNNFGINGAQCLRRTICEAAEAPVNQNNGMIGDLFHLLFTPNKYVDGEESNLLESDSSDDYYDARKAGELNYDCKKLYSLCPLGHGIFDFISVFE